MRAAVIIVAFLTLAVCIVGVNASTDRPRRVIGYGQVRVNGHGPEWWWNRYRAERRMRQRLEERLDRCGRLGHWIAFVYPGSRPICSACLSQLWQAEKGRP